MGEEDLRSMMETFERDFKEIEHRIKTMKTQMERMRKAIEQIEKRESTGDSQVNVVFDLTGPQESSQQQKKVVPESEKTEEKKKAT